VKIEGREVNVRGQCVPLLLPRICPAAGMSNLSNEAEPDLAGVIIDWDDLGRLRLTLRARRSNLHCFPTASHLGNSHARANSVSLLTISFFCRHS
jgi:hypothetical protein